jgi:hypothetical protein
MLRMKRAWWDPHGLLSNPGPNYLPSVVPLRGPDGSSAPVGHKVTAQLHLPDELLESVGSVPSLVGR